MDECPSQTFRLGLMQPVHLVQRSTCVIGYDGMSALSPVQELPAEGLLLEGSITLGGPHTMQHEVSCILTPLAIINWLNRV